MELRQWIRGVLDGAKDGRAAWDAVWAAVLDGVLRRRELPDATAFDIERELHTFLKDSNTVEEGQQEAAGEAWCTNRGGPAEAWSELWARLAARDGTSEWLHLSSRGCGRHAELQLVDAVNARPQLRSVTVLANVSPCSECAAALRQLCGRVRLSLRFAAVFAHHGDNHRAGLQQLAAAGAELAVFGPREWALVVHRQVADRRHPEDELAKEARPEDAASRKRAASEDVQSQEQATAPSAKRARV
ncbi:uncharacterized protein LOC124549434 [Schistocerca americana]|uniref:uncharacterized protein LOC124549434 n=1 Tax=Schistocerca americana TaxID=7009 RepID=UPI001F4F3DD4|nr:uncharacterized protein LOC124549434 [Schistocerca americana]